MAIAINEAFSERYIYRLPVGTVGPTVTDFVKPVSLDVTKSGGAVPTLALREHDD